uniref:Uncharacterized protein n=1 Tax=Peronospora matthiolae TaxID=2874970 RepID=A0AAV1UH90_9STRA
MTPLCQLEIPPRGDSKCLDQSDRTCITPKRKHLSESSEEFLSTLIGTKRPCGRPRDANNVQLSTAHEIRLLKGQVASMDKELRDLQTKWTQWVPDKTALSTAYRSLCEKRAANIAEQTHGELQVLLRQQQLVFATLQTAVLHAPLHSSGYELFEALHFHTKLGLETDERENVLLAHRVRSLATLHSIVDEFSQVALANARSKQNKSVGDKSILPLSQFDVTGCKDCTLLSSTFISEIPHTSLEEVYAAVLAYFDAIPRSMKTHFGVHTTRSRLNNIESPVIYRRSSFSGSGLEATINNIVCSELTASHGMVHVDTVTNDPLYPVPASASSQCGLCGLTVTPHKDPMTGKTLSVTLRWLAVYRYNMLPHELADQQGMKIMRPVLNGDLITASVCAYIQQQRLK